jgi:hypothetical protein
MKNHNYYSTLFGTLLFTFLFSGSFAQVGVSPESYYIAGSGTQSSSRYLFTVVFKDGHTETFKSNIFYNRKAQKSYLKNRGKIITPAETKEIFRSVSRRDQSRIIGYPYKQIWFFPIITGKINCLSPYAENSEVYITHFQKEGDTIAYPFSKKDTTDLVLLNMLSDNTNAHNMMLKSLKAKKNKKIIGYSAIGSWAAFLVGGAASAVFPPASYLSIAGIFAIIPTTFIAYPIIVGKPAKRRLKAIKIYNGIQSRK